MNNGKPTPERLKLSDNDKRMMLQCFMRLPRAMQAAQEHLQVTDFAEADREYQTLWKILSTHYEQYGDLPDRAVLVNAVKDYESQFDANGDEDFDTARLVKIIRGAFNWKLSESRGKQLTRWSLRTLRQFVEERLAEETASVAVTRRTMPQDFSVYLSSHITRLDRLRAIDDGEGESVLFAENWEPRGLDITPTNTFLDQFMGGGTTPGEVIGLLAGYGVGKTTFGVQLTIAGAKYECVRQRRAAWDGKKRVHFMFFWELGHPDEIRIRALSCAGQVSKTALEQMKSLNDLSTSKRPDSLKPYERTILEDVGIYRGEQERCKIWMPLLNTHTAFIDMTGQDTRHPGRGAGGIKEVQSIVARYLDEHKGTVVGGIVIDFVGAMLDRQMDAEGKDAHNHLRHLARKTVLKAKNELASRFQCPTYLLHQLSADANGRAPGSVAKGTDAAEIRGFNQHCDFGFALGLPTSEGCLVVNCDKHRRQPPRRMQIVRVRGDLARIESCNGDMSLDPVTHRIISSSERDSISNGSVRRRPAPAHNDGYAPRDMN